ncbi:MAG: NAD(P)-binding domain-containing protein [Chloroflexi bacterium]|nr:NAD(P)-binding domain-containing protein [Chloroflexota bacterium]
MSTLGNSQSDSTVQTVDTLIIGGGQAGLSAGHALKERDIEFVIVDASQRVGDAWRSRWDSLRLFTPARMNGLPGMPFPGPGNSFVGKDQIANYLEDYARTMELPVRSGVRVERLDRDGDWFTVITSAGNFASRNVIVAMADYQKPKIPDFASSLDENIVQVHSFDYKNPSQLRDGAALVVGLGNSGADISYELATSRHTILSGSESAAIPFKLESWFGRHIGTRLVRFTMVQILNTSTPIGRRVRPKMLLKSAPLVRNRPKELAGVGVERVSRITAVENGKPVTADGNALDVENVVWGTGYQPGFDWISLPVFDESGKPRHRRGIVDDVPGFYFLGLFFLHAVWSETLPGLQPDVRHIIKHLANRTYASLAV